VAHQQLISAWQNEGLPGYAAAAAEDIEAGCGWEAVRGSRFTSAPPCSLSISSSLHFETAVSKCRLEVQPRGALCSV
jgi:hypothetical protein